MCSIHIAQFIFHLPVHWISQIAIESSCLDVRDLCFVRMEACFLFAYPLAFWDEEGWGGERCWYSTDFPEGYPWGDCQRVLPGWGKNSSRKYSWHREMLLNFMPYDSPCDEEQASKLSTVVFTDKVFRLDISFIIIIIIRTETASENKRLYNRGRKWLLKISQIHDSGNYRVMWLRRDATEGKCLFIINGIGKTVRKKYWQRH